MQLSLLGILLNFCFLLKSHIVSYQFVRKMNQTSSIYIYDQSICEECIINQFVINQSICEEDE